MRSEVIIVLARLVYFGNAVCEYLYCVLLMMMLTATKGRFDATSYLILTCLQ